MSEINASWPSGIIYLNRSHIWIANIFLGTFASEFKREHSVIFLLAMFVMSKKNYTE